MAPFSKQSDPSGEQTLWQEEARRPGVPTERALLLILTNIALKKNLGRPILQLSTLKSSSHRLAPVAVTVETSASV